MIEAALVRSRRLATGLSAFAVRVALLFAVIVMVSDALQRFVSQVAPTVWWFTLSRVEILPGGDVTIVYRRSRSGDLPLAGITELIGPDGEQPCSFSNRRVIEAGTTRAVVPTERLLPDCNWRALPDGEYALQLTFSFAAPGGFTKSATVRSTNNLVLHNGAIAGATPLPGGTDGARPGA